MLVNFNRKHTGNGDSLSGSESTTSPNSLLKNFSHDKFYSIIWGFAYNLSVPMITFKMNVIGGFQGLSKWTKAAKKRRRIGAIFSG